MARRELRWNDQLLIPCSFLDTSTTTPAIDVNTYDVGRMKGRRYFYGMAHVASIFHAMVEMRDRVVHATGSMKSIRVSCLMSNPGLVVQSSFEYIPG